MMYIIFSFFMVLLLITLNTGGCSNATKNASFKSYFDLLPLNYDVILLQETYNLSENCPFWKNWSNYVPFSAPGVSPGSGVNTLVKNNIDVIASGVVFKGSILFLKIKVDNNIYNIYNFLVSQSNVFALKSFTEFSTHCDQHKDGPVIIGGDFNCTDNPSIDRLHRPTEHRPQVAMGLGNSTHCLYLCDIWRRLNPSENKFTWFRNSKSVLGGVSKARLDRFYDATSIIPSIHSCQIILCSLSDHSAVSLCFKCPPRNKGSAYWHFNNSLLEDKNYHDIISLFWSNWQLENHQ